MIIVRCIDGKVRHQPEGFATKREAREWAEYGHCCVRSHTFTTTDQEASK